MENVLVIFKEEEEREEECKEHQKTIESVYKILKNEEVKYRAVCRNRVTERDFKGIDLIIVIGGDGTFLRTSQFCGEIPLWGVNSNPKETEGFFMRCTMKTFERSLKKIKSGKETMLGLTRLQAAINGKQAVPCLNEYFVGHQKPYGVAEYNIKTPEGKEHQKSSGVLISTAAGSHAWTRSAGGEILEINDTRFQFVVREPYTGTLTRPTRIRGVLKPREKIIIEIGGKDMLLISDSVSKEYLLNKGDIIEITASKEKCWLVE